MLGPAGRGARSRLLKGLNTFMEDKPDLLANLVLWSIGLFTAGSYLFLLGYLILHFISYRLPCS